ncbi:hypothetical protein OIO90_002371 [Microbotryomycetes sp. JL221]|nr:hypothetical protein OIO90_002371 [Microbotryomycetes sp. JL221]
MRLHSSSAVTRLVCQLVVATSLLVAVASASIPVPDNYKDLPVQQLLSLAQTALLSGDTQTALTLYDECVERDNSDAATLYKRATVRLALGQWSRAKEGFNEVVNVNNKWHQAYVQLAKLETKLGQLDEALKSVNEYLKLATDESTTDYQEMKQLMSDIATARKEIKKANKAADMQQYPQCIASATSVLQLCPNSESMRLLRAECYYFSNEFDSAIGDLTRASTLTSTFKPHLALRISLLDAFLIDHGGLTLSIDTSLMSVKRCLASDPDSKPCRKLFKSLKKLDKEVTKAKNWIDSSRWTEVALSLAGSSTDKGIVDKVKDMIEEYTSMTRGLVQAPLPVGTGTSEQLADKSPLLRSAMSTLCRAYVMLGRTRKAENICEQVLRTNEDDVWALTSRGDGFMNQDKFEDAVRVYSKAFENSGRSDREILARLQKAQRLHKQSNSKDYYKILGVSRDADDKTIKRAYRKGTLKSHPDKEGGSEEKMAALNEAYEVLSNPELRARFDNGEDPNDPQSSQQHPFFQGGGGHAHPFAQMFQQGGFHAGHGGQQFQFTWG